MNAMIKRVGALGAVVGLVGLAAGGTATAAAGGRVDRVVVQRAIDELTAGAAAGAQVRITDGRQTFTARSGVAEWGGGRPVPTDGRFRVGSITKVFVSVVVLQLVGEGRIDLDAPVSRHLPGLLPDGDRITVRMLLQHTSGLRSYTGELPLDPEGFEAIRYKHWEPAELVALSTAKPLDFAPGTDWDYSNTNYVVAGLLVEKITGKPYARAVEQRILGPLRMRDTTVPGDRVDVPGPHANGYVRIGDRVVDITRINPSVAHSAGEMISTTADLDRFVAAVAEGKLLKPAQFAEMTGLTDVSPGYGLGLEWQELACGAEVIGHGGGIPGYSSLMLASEDGRVRLEASFTSAPADGPTGGVQELIDEVFCD
ncbi:serine hydrolase domain-containing protein [Umezawaea sp. Da 62-37]|uniref:serine hydrolase domain-containing protein n=1 Tax=Umezawaea sp. Da 62-37 TaxID=3075927 RepID=UPI0028F71B59|nr:serine hydrolase domain-containing protein [Umezawaea sp. Da 62-37]WNV90448.1 serine hydrolase domain-containing protein [Umezawaea sp. Da 62-37]